MLSPDRGQKAGTVACLSADSERPYEAGSGTALISVFVPRTAEGRRENR